MTIEIPGMFGCIVIAMVRSSLACQITSNTEIASPLPFTASAAISRVERRSRSGSRATVAPVVMIWLALAISVMREATLTVSPNRSPFSSITAPAWKPTRIAREWAPGWIWESGTGWLDNSLTRTCISVAAR